MGRAEFSKIGGTNTPTQALKALSAWWRYSPNLLVTRENVDSDVGSTHPGGEEASKGLAVRQLKRHVSWVQTVARQVGPYLP